MEQRNERMKRSITKAFKLSKIDVQKCYVDMSALYDARNRAIEELDRLGKNYNEWGETTHRRLQIAADNVMLVNIIEDLFHYGNKRGSRSYIKR